MQTLNQIRKTFIDYFVKQGHTHVQSSPLVPQNDPTLMFTAAGMVQFKDLFTGNETRSYSKAVTAQKCLRAGGKHNDLDNVGYTARHHTFFEMLGNFSFGDYFKEDAIKFAFDVVTKDFDIDPKKLTITVYADDDEAAALWRKIGGFSDDKIIRIGTSDNFWSMGETGPCGPCSEIFYDYGDHVAGGPPGSANEDGDRFVEIWNLVFMQYEQMASGERILLPRPSIDTGMGLERIASVLQGKNNNFDIDLFTSLIDHSKLLTKNTDPNMRQSHNVIADHLRATSFLIADGVLPSNEGRGYVLRRILRRAMRHAHMLGAQEPIMWQMVATLIRAMGENFPELCRAKSLIEQTLLNEEERFNQTLSRGLKVLRDETNTLKPQEPISGEVAFKLYDTYGFPLDLTEDVLRAENRTVDRKGFEEHMELQKQRARAAWVGSGDTANEQVWLDLREEFGPTEFLGYTVTQAEGVVFAIIKDGIRVPSASIGDDIWVLLNQTPFYAESGGQAGDKGSIDNDKMQVSVSDCIKKVGTLFAHKCHVIKGQIHQDDMVKTHMDSILRKQIAANHSATHLLQAALRHVLGDHVAQKGSHVDANRLRFDFTHPKAVTLEELAAVEQLVNQEIAKNHTTKITISSPEKAISEGALALFGERYGDEVRVVSFGAGQNMDQFSVELCGGTHVHATAEIGLFKIISEASVSAGVRRIEAITSNSILNYIRELEDKNDSLLEQNRKNTLDLNKQISSLKTQMALSMCQNAHLSTEIIGKFTLSFTRLKDVLAKDLKPIAEQIRTRINSGIVCVSSEIDGKVAMVVALTPDYVDKLSAIDIVRLSAQHLGGQGGGGRVDLAQGGGEKIEQLNTLENIIKQYLSTL